MEKEEIRNDNNFSQPDGLYFVLHEHVTYKMLQYCTS